MGKLLIFEDTRQINNALKSIEKHIPVLQRIVSGFFYCNVSVKLVEIRDMVVMFSQNSRIYDKRNSMEGYIEDFLRQKVIDGMNEVPKINGIVIDKSKMVEMVKLPDFSELSKEIIRYRSSYISYGCIDFNLLEIDNGTVKLIPDAIEKVKETHRIYAATKKGIQTYIIAKSIVDNLNELEKHKHRLEIFGGNICTLELQFKFLSLQDGVWGLEKSFLSNIDN